MPDEAARLRTVRRYELLDASRESAFDRITSFAARLMATPCAVLGIFDQERVLFKATWGVGDLRELPRSEAFWRAVVASRGVFTVTDVAADPSLKDGGLATSPIGARFFAACPLQVDDGVKVGVLAVFGPEPRELDTYEREILEDLGGIVEHELELRHAARRIATQEQQLQHLSRMEAVGRLAGGVAHEFNNIVMAIDANVALLEGEGIGDEERREILTQLRGACTRAAAQTQQLLDFAKGRRSSAEEHTDLGDVVEKLAPVVRSLAGDRTLSIEVRGKHLHVVAAPAQVEQLLVNLVLHARDATAPTGTIRIVVEHKKVPAGDPRIPGLDSERRFAILRIIDDGPGIPGERRDHVFEPFFARKDGGDGAGLGLSICWRIARSLGGGIDVESASGTGTTFRVYLPLAESARQRFDNLQDTRISSKPTLRKPGILLVDDDVHIRFALRRLLARDGFTVFEAGSADEALLTFDAHQDQVDLVVSDVVMPGAMTGRALADALRAKVPTLPVLLISGYAPAELDLAPYAFMGKPVDPILLRQKVRQMLESSGR